MRPSQCRSNMKTYRTGVVAVERSDNRLAADCSALVDLAAATVDLTDEAKEFLRSRVSQPRYKSSLRANTNSTTMEITECPRHEIVGNVNPDVSGVQSTPAALVSCSTKDGPHLVPLSSCIFSKLI